MKVTWKFPEHVTPEVDDDWDPEDDHFPHGSRLTLTNVDHTMVGFYHCQQVDEHNTSVEEAMESFKANAFYIYVDGKMRRKKLSKINKLK